MGNAQIQNSDNYLCNGDLLAPSVLIQTSLRPLCRKNCPKTVAASVCDHEEKENIPQTILNTKTRLCHSDQKKNPKTCPRTDTKQFLTENDFHILKVLGAEGFGKMYLVKKNDDGKMYTMKTMDKRKIANLGCLASIESERLIFEKANHPYIPKLKYTFENDKKIFFMFDHIEGDKLNVLLHNLTKFSEEITRFYASEIIATLEYLHKEMKTSYQDIETDHIRLDDEGHINLTDFAHAKSIELDEKSPTSKQKIEDFYHLGCLIYELLAGEKILESEESRQDPSKKLSLAWPKHVSRTARDLITRLISSKTDEKFGFNDISEIKKHKFFAGVNWDKIQHKLMYPPLSPPQDKDKDDYIKKENMERNFPFNSFPYTCELDEIMERQPKHMKPDFKRKVMI